MLNIQNYVHSLKNCVCWIYRFVLVLWKILYLKCAKLGIFFEKLCMFNIHNFYILWKIVNVQCTKLSTFFLKKKVYIEYIEFDRFYENLYLEYIEFEYIFWNNK